MRQTAAHQPRIMSCEELVRALFTHTIVYLSQFSSSHQPFQRLFRIKQPHQVWEITPFQSWFGFDLLWHLGRLQWINILSLFNLFSYLPVEILPAFFVPAFSPSIKREMKTLHVLWDHGRAGSEEESSTPFQTFVSNPPVTCQYFFLGFRDDVLSLLPFLIQHAHIHSFIVHQYRTAPAHAPGVFDALHHLHVV
jgi:hypothetical protein